MNRHPQFHDGRRNGIKWAIEWLHRRALEMRDPHAAQVLNAAAFNMGVDAKRAPVVLDAADLSGNSGQLTTQEPTS